jgi:hypothetical protein
MLNRFVFALLVGLLPFQLQASDKSEWRNWPNGERLEVGVLGYLPKLDTTVLIQDTAVGAGSAISFEDNLNLDSRKSTALVDGKWRFFKRHSLKFNYFSLDRSSFEPANSGSLFVGDVEVDVNLPIETFFDVDVFDLSYAYSLLFDEKKELSVGIGLSVQRFNLGVRGTPVDLDDVNVPLDQLYDERLEITAPLPTLDLGYSYAFNDKWLLDANLGWLAVELQLDDDEDLSGSIISADISMRWKAFKYAGFRFGYQLFDVNVDYEKRRLKGHLDYSYRGPTIGVEAFF